MATTRGRCTNVDYCSIAAAKRDVAVKIGEDFTCPECARALHAPPLSEASGGSRLVLIGGAVAAMLVGGGVYAGYRLSGHAAPPPAVVARAEAPPILPAATLPPLAPAARATVKPALAILSSPEPVGAEPATLLRLRGAPALAGLASRLASAYLASIGDGAVVTEPGAALNETVVTGLRAGRPETISIVAGSGSGLNALGRGTADIGMATHRATAAEQQALHGQGGLDETAVALNGLAVIVNPHNPIASITLPQLRGVLDGSITNWSQLGFGSATIRVAVSDGVPADGVMELGGDGPAALERAPRTTHAAAVVMAGADTIALVPRALAGQARMVPVAELGARPALPSAEAIADGSYKLSERLYFTAPAGADSNPVARRFIAYALSPEGQAVVGQAGLVPLHVSTRAAAPLTAVDHYRQLVTGATRLAADLHFEASSNKLDLHSSREVDRVWNFMMSDHTSPDHLILMGFADNQGTPEANLALSRQRAQAVAAVFAGRGLPPGQVVAFGADLPLADNDNEAGREKNRRVEVFLRN